MTALSRDLVWTKLNTRWWGRSTSTAFRAYEIRERGPGLYQVRSVYRTGPKALNGHCTSLLAAKDAAERHNMGTR